MAYKVQAYTQEDGWADVIRLLEPDMKSVRLHIFKTVEAAIEAWEKERRGLIYDAPNLPAHWANKPIVIGNYYRVVAVGSDEIVYHGH